MHSRHRASDREQAQPAAAADMARVRLEAAAKASQALQSRLDALQSPQAQAELEATRATAYQLEKQAAEQAAMLGGQKCAHEDAAMEGQAAALLEEYNNKVGRCSWC